MMVRRAIKSLVMATSNLSSIDPEQPHPERLRKQRLATGATGTHFPRWAPIRSGGSVGGTEQRQLLPDKVFSVWTAAA